MKSSSNPAKRSFVVATPGHSHIDEDKARALASVGRLHFIAKGTRRGTVGVPPELTRLNPKLGLAVYASAMTMSTFKAESFRYRLNPWFDRWVRKKLRPGDHIISSYGYANESFKRVRAQGGKTVLSAGNSHPENFWNILEEEHRRWNCSDPPIARHHYERALAMMADVDYVLSPSSFVSRSFLERGFKPGQILQDIYSVDLACFAPRAVPREKNRPLTIISTGALSLRKGSPYLLEALRLVLQRHPSARFRLTSQIQDSALPVVAKYRDLPVDWSPNLPHPLLAERLQGSDIFILPSLEDGFARTVIEALACGLPVITTPNTGASDLIQSGVNGEVVPIRDPKAIADAVLKWADQILAPDWQPRIQVNPDLLTYDYFARVFIDQLTREGLI